MSDTVNTIRLELLELADEKTKKTGHYFSKEPVMLHGVKTALVSKIAKKHFELIKSKSKAEIFDLCEELWQSGYLEESFIACKWSFFIRKDYEPDDFKIFEKWVDQYVNNWASCDTLCNHTVGAFVARYPNYINDLKKWTSSSNRWMRRAAAVSLIIPARKGKFLNDIVEIADLLLTDQDDLVQKGYGWLLKSASQVHQTAIFEYVMSKKAVMPRTSLRYAIEKMPPELKAEAMKK